MCLLSSPTGIMLKQEVELKINTFYHKVVKAEIMNSGMGHIREFLSHKPFGVKT
jgi:hypothetical protein